MFKKIMFVILVASAMLLQGPNLWADDDAIMDVDDNAAAFVGTWPRSTFRILYYGDDYQYAAGSGGAATASATFTTAQTADITGRYHVYVRWTAGTARATNARYNIYDDTNAYKGACIYDQRNNGGVWMFCNEVTLNAGRRGRVIINNANVPPDRYVCADAVRFVRVDKDVSDIVDDAGVDFTGGNQFTYLTSTATVVRSVTIVAPASGFVVVNASGYFALLGGGGDQGTCSITTGTSIDTNNQIFGIDGDNSNYVYMPIGATRGFSVGAGSRTFNLVCSEQLGNVVVGDTYMTAIFSRTQY